MRVNLDEALCKSRKGPNNEIIGEEVDRRAWGDLAVEGQYKDVYYVKQDEEYTKSYKIYKNGSILTETGIKVNEGFVNCIAKINRSLFVAGFVYPFGKRKRINNYLQLFSKHGRLLDQFEYEIRNEEDGNNEPILLKTFCRKSTEFCVLLRKMDFIDIFCAYKRKIKPIALTLSTLVTGEEFSAHKDILVFERDKAGVQIVILKNNYLGVITMKV